MLKLNRRAMIALAAAMASAPAFAPAFAQEATAPGDFSIGSADAPVKIVEYASFTCPHCANFHAAVFQDLKRDYIDTGKVHFTLREVYFDRYGLWAAMVARCGGDMRYYDITGMLFAQQAEWLDSPEPMQVLANLRTIGVAAGLDGAAIDVCLNDATQADALVAQFETNMKADAVKGTPTLFVNGTMLSNLTYDDLKVVIDAELAK